MPDNIIKNYYNTDLYGGELVITRVYNAPPKRVWVAWSQAEYLRKWWGPRGFSAPAAKIDFRPGGHYLICMQSDGCPKAWREDIWSTGVYRENVPLERIVTTDSFADDQGKVVPASHYGMEGDWPRVLLATVTFKEIGGNTEITLRHAGIPAGENREGAYRGWNQSLDKLAASLK